MWTSTGMAKHVSKVSTNEPPTMPKRCRKELRPGGRLRFARHRRSLVLPPVRDQARPPSGRTRTRLASTTQNVPLKPIFFSAAKSSLTRSRNASGDDDGKRKSTTPEGPSERQAHRSPCRRSGQHGILAGQPRAPRRPTGLACSSLPRARHAPPPATTAQRCPGNPHPRETACLPAVIRGRQERQHAPTSGSRLRRRGTQKCHRVSGRGSSR
jgi:hypothetical protein